MDEAHRKRDTPLQVYFLLHGDSVKREKREVTSILQHLGQRKVFTTLNHKKIGEKLQKKCTNLIVYYILDHCGS